MINKTDALQLWQHEMGDKDYAYDFTGKKIKQSDYLENNQVGWVITYLKPLELGGPNNISNKIIMHHRTYEERGQSYPKFSIDNDEYVVQYDQKGDFYYIERIFDEDEDDEGVFI